MKSTRYQKPKEKKKKKKIFSPWDTPQIPEDAKVGVYGRQSTKNQVKNNLGAGEMQIDMLIDFTRQLGVDSDNIILYIENIAKDGSIKNASGRLRIDQREGLSSLVERIESGEIKAVVVFLEDRLFRDETQIEVNKFILICQENDCLVITPYMTYDFNSSYHRKQFRWKCEQAADFLEEYIKHRLLDKREQFALRGQYDGRSIPVGFIVDRRQYIEGVPNPNFKKLIPYPPHAERVVWIFNEFVRVGGKPKRLFEQLKELPVLFPSFDSSVDIRTVSKLALKKVPGGYHISFNGLQQLLTNVVYIGWWTYRGQIVKNNHSAIVAEDKFWYAFKRLSDLTPEGKPQERERYRPRYHKHHKEEAPALLKDIITTNDPKKSVYVGNRFDDWYYIIMWKDVHENVPEMYSALVDHVDEAFKSALLAHMHNTEHLQFFRKYAEEVKQETGKKQIDIKEETARIDKRMKATLLSLTSDPDLPVVTRTALNHIYAELVKEKEELIKPQEEEVVENNISDLLDYHELLERLSREGEFDKVMSDMKRLAEATVKSITIDGISPHFILLTINWRTPVWGTDLALLWRPHGRAPFWSEEEYEIVRQNYPTMPQIEIMKLLPGRSWQGIRQKAFKLKVKREEPMTETCTYPTLSYDDVKVMEKYELKTEQLSSDIQIIWF